MFVDKKVITRVEVIFTTLRHVICKHLFESVDLIEECLTFIVLEMGVLDRAFIHNHQGGLDITKSMMVTLKIPHHYSTQDSHCILLITVCHLLVKELIDKHDFRRIRKKLLTDGSFFFWMQIYWQRDLL